MQSLNKFIPSENVWNDEEWFVFWFISGFIYRFMYEFPN